MLRFKLNWLSTVAVLCAAAVLASQTASAPESGSVPGGGWSVGGSLRLRAESLEDSFRIVAPPADRLLFSRLELALRYNGPDWFAVAEMQDSRAWGGRRFSPIGTDDVNVLEPVNLHLGRRWRSGDREWTASLGRMTLDHGGRRLLARNRFRNTSNAFQMGRLEYRYGAHYTQVFYGYPLQREPTDFERDEVTDNRFRWDKAGRSETFWGLTHDWLQGAHTALSVYYFDRERSDRPGRPVADDHLHTLGARALGEPAGWRWEVDGAYQWGESQGSAIDTGQGLLDHRAWSLHASLRRALPAGLSAELAYDVASGDRDPDDGRNQRFDRLYGARAFELGPSGIFGAAVRSNLQSLVLRLRLQPSPAQAWLFSLRSLRLDSARDLLPSAGRFDDSGASGDDIGTQLELRWRYTPAGESWDWELGGAYLAKGRFFDGGDGSAPLNPPSTADAKYLFAAMQWRF